MHCFPETCHSFSFSSPKLISCLQLFNRSCRGNCLAAGLDDKKVFHFINQFEVFFYTCRFFPESESSLEIIKNYHHSRNARHTQCSILLHPFFVKNATKISQFRTYNFAKWMMISVATIKAQNVGIGRHLWCKHFPWKWNLKERDYLPREYVQNLDN